MRPLWIAFSDTEKCLMKATPQLMPWQSVMPHSPLFLSKILIDKTLSGHLNIVAIKEKQYNQSINRVSQLGLVSGVIYDAIHLAVAEPENCKRLYTHNLGHFNRLNPVAVSISSP